MIGCMFQENTLCFIHTLMYPGAARWCMMDAFLVEDLLLSLAGNLVIRALKPVIAEPSHTVTFERGKACWGPSGMEVMAEMICCFS